MACDTTVLTGVDGKVTVDGHLVARITKWAVSPKLASTSEWGDSDSQGYTNRAAGRKDATFSCEGKFDTDHPVWNLFQPGDCGEVILWMTPTLYWLFPCALNSSFNLEVDVDGETVIGWTSEWGANGKFYRPGQSGAASKTLPTSL